jgi:hypothetical protein
MKSKFREFISCFTILLMLVLVTVTFPVWGLIFFIRQNVTEKRHRSRMYRQGRFASWQSILERSEHGLRGTLIVEQAQKAPLRVWWTPDEAIGTNYSEPPPHEDEIDYLRLQKPPFMTWLHERYTGESGRAILTDYHPAHYLGFAEVSNFAETGFSRIIPTVRLS